MISLRVSCACMPLHEFRSQCGYEIIVHTKVKGKFDYKTAQI